MLRQLLLPKIAPTIAFLLFSILSLAPAAARGPLYSTPAWNEHSRTKTLTRRKRQSKPLFGVSRGGHIHTARPASYRQPTRQPDYSSKFLNVEEFKQDKRSRLWNVNFKTRRPGRYSWTSRLVMANVACYAIQMIWPQFTQMGVKLSDKILRGEELYRLLTPVFLHGGIAHLCMNMFSLRNVGPDVEKLFGPGRYLSTYLLAGIAGNLASAYNSPRPALGASGAVFGIVGAQLVFLSRNDWLLGRQGENMQTALMSTILINVGIGMMNPMVDNWGHAGGLIGGGAAAYYFGPRLFLLEMPEGGRCLVDKPVYRLPRKIESIPEKISKKFKRLTRRMQVNQHTSDLPSRPWRAPSQQNYQQRQSVPNKSIKPKRFW